MGAKLDQLNAEIAAVKEQAARVHAAFMKLDTENKAVRNDLSAAVDARDAARETIASQELTIAELQRQLAAVPTGGATDADLDASRASLSQATQQLSDDATRFNPG